MNEYSAGLGGRVDSNGSPPNDPLALPPARELDPTVDKGARGFQPRLRKAISSRRSLSLGSNWNYLIGATCAYGLAMIVATTTRVAAEPVPVPVVPAPSAQRLPWYLTAAAMREVTLKPNSPFWPVEHLSLVSEKEDRQLRDWKTEGIDVVEVFAPEDGGNSYGGLDAKNRYALGPGRETIADFKHLVSTVHSMKMHMVTFQNLGYAAVDAPQFQKAARDVRNGITSRESKFFLWSDRADAPPPAEDDSYFLVLPGLQGNDSQTQEFWQWSQAARHYYWTKWPGKDERGASNRLPQYSWLNSEWPTEARHVVDFWMSTGLDGMILDAVPWYVGYDWQKNARLLAEYRKFPGDKLLVPEGAGVARTADPMGWIRDGGWPALYDYGLDLDVQGAQSHPMRASIEQSNPAIFEEALRKYHDRIVAAGGVLIQPVLDMHDAGRQKLEETLLATSGDILCYCWTSHTNVHPADGIPALLRLKARHPALYQNSTRRRVATDGDQTVYATLRYAADNSERLLVIVNFSRKPVRPTVDTRAIAGSTLRDIERDGEAEPMGKNLTIALPAYGHRIFRVEGFSAVSATQLGAYF
jgi:glycosidase